MRNLETISTSSDQKNRRYRRFSLRYPVQLRFHCQGAILEMQAESKNIGIGGLLLETELPIPQCSSVSFTMTLHGGPIRRPIELAGQGQIVRVETGENGRGFAIAVQCVRPLIEIAEIA